MGDSDLFWLGGDGIGRYDLPDLDGVEPLKMPEFEVTKLYAVTKVSPVSGNQHVMTLLLTPAQWEEIQPFLDPSLPRKRFIQDILPHHAPQEREFILSGTTQQEWDQLWGTGEYSLGAGEEKA